MSTSTEAIIAAATSAEAAAAVAQEQGATLVTVHPAVIEAPVDVTEGQGNEGEENEGDGMHSDLYSRLHVCLTMYLYLLLGRGCLRTQPKVPDKILRQIVSEELYDYMMYGQCMVNVIFASRDFHKLSI